MEFDLQQAIAVLSRTPATLDALLRGLPNVWTTPNEGGESWSAYDIVGHLIHGERTDWIPRARVILQHGDSRPFEPFDRFAQFRDSKGKTLGALLDEFAAQRRGNLEILRGLRLGPRELGLRGVHPAFGVVTLEQLLATWVAHDLGHVAQIARVMAKQYADAVGPWRQYLPVLTR